MLNFGYYYYYDSKKAKTQVDVWFSGFITRSEISSTSDVKLICGVEKLNKNMTEFQFYVTSSGIVHTPVLNFGQTNLQEV